MSPVHAERVNMEVSLLDDMNAGEVGFVSSRFQINEGSTNGYVQIRLWRTLDTRKSAEVTYRLEGPSAALTVLGRMAAHLCDLTLVRSGVVSSGEVFEVECRNIRAVTRRSTSDSRSMLGPGEALLALFDCVEGVQF
jgi:hypothetical protein